MQRQLGQRMLRKTSRRFSGKQGVGCFRKRIDVGRRCQMSGRPSESTGIELSGLHQRVVFRRRINIGSYACDRAFTFVDASHAEVCDLHDLFIGGEQQVLRLDVSMNHAALVCVCKTGADLFQVEQSFLKRQRSRFRERKEIATRQILENDVMKSRAREIDGGAVSKPVYYIWMTNTIESNRFVLKV